MVGCPRPNRWLVEPDSTAGFTQRALVKMQERAKALLSKNKNELPAARKLYVSLDRADNVIEGGPGFVVELWVPFVLIEGRPKVRILTQSGRAGVALERGAERVL
jgi:hypothetical protein